MNKKYLYAHTSQETAYVVDDYPWGFRLRTQIRYWVESKANFGQRFCHQTMNPKTGNWCAPKSSTYTNVIIMYLDEIDHIKYCTLRTGKEENEINDFIAKHKDNLTDFQKEQLKEMIAINNVMKNVTFKVTPSKYGSVSLFSQDPEEVRKRQLIREEQEESKKEQSKIQHKILCAIEQEKKRVEIN